VNLPAGVEWWRPVSLADKRDSDTSHIQPALTTEDSPVAFWALMAFLFILILSPQSIFPVLAPFRIAMLAAALAITVHIAGRLSQSKPIMVLSTETKIVMGLVAWAILTIPLSYWPGGSVAYFLDFYLKTLMIFWLLINVINTWSRFHYLAWSLTLMSIPLALTGVSNYILGVYIEGSTRVDGYSGPLTSNPNDLALMINLILPVTVALFLGARKPLLRMLLAGIIMLNILAVVTTFSRSGFLTLAVIFIVYAYALRKRPERRWAYMAIFIAIMVTPFVPTNYVDRINTITNIESDQSGSSQERWSHMVIATKYVLQNPVAGAGIGMNILALDRERGSYGTAVHNVYLQYAVELGLPGLILFLLLLKTSIANVSVVQQRLSSAGKYTEFFCLAEGIRISLIAFMMAALFYPIGYHFYFYIFAGLAAAAKLISDNGTRSRSVDENLPEVRI